MDSLSKAWKLFAEQAELNLNELQTREEKIGSREKIVEEKESKLQSFDDLIRKKERALVEQLVELESKLEQFTSQMKTEYLESSPAIHIDDSETHSTSKRSASNAEEAFGSIAKGSVKKQMTEKESPIDSNTKTTTKKQSSEFPAKVPAEDQVKCITSKKAKAEPSKEDLRVVIIDILDEVDFKTATFSNFLRQIGTHFGIDLMHRKAEVMEILTEIYDMSDEEDEKKAGGCDDPDKDNELDSKHKRFNSQTKTKHLVSTPSGDHKTAPSRAIHKHATSHNSSFLVKQEEPESSLGRHAIDESDVPGLLDQNFCGIDAVQNEFASSLRSVPDPAEFVLSSIRKSLVPYFRKGHYEESVMSRNILILKELMIVTQHVGSHLKEDATYLVSQWKAKKSHGESSMESLVFLLFITMYGLVSLLNGYEIVKHLGLISQSRTALESCQTHGFAPKIADIIRNLIDKEQALEAVRFIYTFKLVDQLSPVPVLESYVQDANKFDESFRSRSTALDEKVKAVDIRIGKLRAVQQCIKDYSLENEYPCAEVELHIVHLQRVKENLRRLASTPIMASNQQG